MAKNHSIAPEALRDIGEIATYIRAEDRSAARRFLQEIHRRFASLATRPAAFRIRPEFGPAVRVAHYSHYLIFYEIIDGITRIQRVIHGARELGEALKDDSP